MHHKISNSYLKSYFTEQKFTKQPIFNNSVRQQRQQQNLTQSEENWWNRNTEIPGVMYHQIVQDGMRLERL